MWLNEMGIDEIWLDKMGIDEMWLDEMGINLYVLLDPLCNKSLFLSYYYTHC